MTLEGIRPYLSLSLRCCCYVVYNTMLSDWQPPISPPWVAPRGAHQLQPILCTCPCAFLRLFLLPSSSSFYRLISQHGDWQRCETKGGLAAWNAGYRIQGVAQPTPRVSVCRFFRVHLSISRLHTSSSPPPTYIFLLFWVDTSHHLSDIPLHWNVETEKDTFSRLHPGGDIPWSSSSCVYIFWPASSLTTFGGRDHAAVAIAQPSRCEFNCHVSPLSF